MKYIFFAVATLFLFFIIRKVDTGFTDRSNKILFIAAIFVAGVVVITDGLLAIWQSITVGITLGLLFFIVLQSRLVDSEEQEPIMKEGQESEQNTDIEKKVSDQDRAGGEENDFIQNPAGIVEAEPSLTTLQFDERGGDEEEMIQSRTGDLTPAIEVGQHSHVSEDQLTTLFTPPKEHGTDLEDELLAARPQVIDEREEQTSFEIDKYSERRKIDLEKLIEMDDREQDSDMDKKDEKQIKRVNHFDDYEIPEMDFENSSKDKEN